MSAAEVAIPEDSKTITRLYWSYGEEEIEVADISRHYADLNLHVETINYQSGETAIVEIESLHSEKLIVNVPIQKNGTGVLYNIFKDISIALEEPQ